MSPNMRVRRNTITVVDVCRELGVEPYSDLTWSVGARVRDLYEARFGYLPGKELRPKTRDRGSHCFAVYPVSMRDAIAEIIGTHRTEARRQRDLFDDGDPA
jgi:hypothetical protein